MYISESFGKTDRKLYSAAPCRTCAQCRTKIRTMRGVCNEMKIESVFDAAFKPYGEVLQGYDTKALVDAADAIPLPQSGTRYEPAIAQLEATAAYDTFRDHFYGGMPVQIGMCWGSNTKLNCLEYHRDSEVNIGTTDFILLLARRDEMENGVLSTAKVKAFRVPAGLPVEVYATTLHYAPCNAVKDGFFRVIVILPRTTNTEAPSITPLNEEDTRMTARNKWLLAHPDAKEAKAGAYVGLTGKNIDLAADL